MGVFLYQYWLLVLIPGFSTNSTDGMSKTLKIPGSYLFILLLLLSSFAPASGQKDGTRPKIGLVLSGGGSKGFAHVGALKVLEEAGIPIDYIGGTSIGSVIGGLYALGYDARTIEEFVISQDWDYLRNDEVSMKYIPVIEQEQISRYNFSLPVKARKVEFPQAILQGQNILNTLADLSIHHHNIVDFSELHIPFLCVAVDLETGEEVVMDKGDLVNAIRASMAIPANYSPMEIDGRLLADGGILNNFPVDRVREKGVDIIIGVNVLYGLRSRKELQSIPNIIRQMAVFLGNKRLKKNIKDVDYYIKPNLKAFSSFDFSKENADTLIALGEKAARKILPQLLRLCDSLNIQPGIQPIHNLPERNEKFFITDLQIHGIKKFHPDYVLGISQFELPGKLTLEEIGEGINRLFGSQDFNYVTYRVKGKENNVLHLYVKEKGLIQLNFGLHYDSETHASILVNVTSKNKKRYGGHLSVDAKLSQNPMTRLQYSLERGIGYGFVSSLEANKNEYYSYKNGHKDDRFSLFFSKIEMYTHSIFFNRILMGFGARGEYYNLVSSTAEEVPEENSFFIDYFAFMQFNSFDKIHFPTKGVSLKGEYKIVTDDGMEYKNHRPFSTVRLNVKSVIPFSERLSFIPAFYGRAVFGKDIPYFHKSFIGGVEQLDYLDNLVPFQGLHRMEIRERNILVLRTDFRRRFSRRHYLTLKPNIGFYSNTEKIFKKDGFIYGGGITYSYNSVMGPVEATLGGSSFNDEPFGFINIGVWF